MIPKTDEKLINILLVDDDPRNLVVLESILDSSDYHLTKAQSGQEALMALLNQDFALLVLDIEMPGMNGQETLKRIRANPALREVPVVMMTGVADEDQMKLAAVNGANSYTIKPANAEQFLRTVLASTNYWLTIHQSPQHHLRPEDCRR